MAGAEPVYSACDFPRASHAAWRGSYLRRSDETTSVAHSLSAALLLAAVPLLGQAQTKEVTIAHQDMMVPYRFAKVQGEIEKATATRSTTACSAVVAT